MGRHSNINGRMSNVSTNRNRVSAYDLGSEFPLVASFQLKTQPEKWPVKVPTRKSSALPVVATGNVEKIG